MPNSKIKPQDVDKLELFLHEGIMERIPIPKEPKPVVMILVFCNSGPQLKDRLTLYWKLKKDIHPVLTHGGITRLSSTGKCFDEIVLKGVQKATVATKHAGFDEEDTDFGAEAHYPCGDGDLRGFNLEQTLLHAYYGWVEYNRRFGTQKPVELYFHFDFTKSGIPGRIMEMYKVNPEKLAIYIQQNRLVA